MPWRFVGEIGDGGDRGEMGAVPWNDSLVFKEFEDGPGELVFDIPPGGGGPRIPGDGEAE